MPVCDPSGGGLETIGGIDFVQNMVMTSRDGVLRLFPWLPENGDVTQASFTNLRAMGGFRVSANYSLAAGGVSGKVRIAAGPDDRRCVLEQPANWKSLSVCKLAGGKAAAVAVTALPGGEVAFTASAEKLYVALDARSC